MNKLKITEPSIYKHVYFSNFQLIKFIQSEIITDFISIFYNL